PPIRLSLPPISRYAPTPRLSPYTTLFRSGVPGNQGLATLKGQSIEASNVDLSAELVNMIIAQRTYQANAQTIKTQDQVMQTLIRSEEHTSELQSRFDLVCRLLLEKKN